MKSFTNTYSSSAFILVPRKSSKIMLTSSNTHTCTTTSSMTKVSRGSPSATINKNINSNNNGKIKHILSMYSSDTMGYNIQNPESSSSSSSESKSNIDNLEQLKEHEQQPNLFYMPSSLSPVYKSMSIITKTLIGIFSVFFSTVSSHSSSSNGGSLLSSLLTSSSTIWKQGRNSIRMIIQSKSFLKFVLKFMTIASLSTIFIQETFHSPSRIDTMTLLKRKWLPSTLSKFSIISTKVPAIVVENNNDYDDNDDLFISSNGQVEHDEEKSENDDIKMDPLGVHYLHYKSINDHDDNNHDIPSLLEKEQQEEQGSNDFDFDTIHFNHGFGASSLSWLPAIPSLVQKLKSKSGIAHDSPGFGFTDRLKTLGRVNSLVPYTSAGSASLGNALLLNEIGYHNNNNDEDDGDKYDEKDDDSNEKKYYRVGLFGHSMGCATTLKMALSLPRDIEKLVVLVAPALIGPPPKKLNPNNQNERGQRRTTSSSSPSTLFQILSRNLSWLTYSILTSISLLRRVALDTPLMFILKRIVGQKDFWKNGLRLAWGNPDLVTDADALRFQWHSIGLGWENGLLAFTRSRIFSICSYKGKGSGGSGGEQQLLEDVINLPNTSVVIIHGTKDPVIPVQMSQKIVQRLPPNAVSYIELDGLGHDPFEEQVDEFANLF